MRSQAPISFVLGLVLSCTSISVITALEEVDMGTRNSNNNNNNNNNNENGDIQQKIKETIQPWGSSPHPNDTEQQQQQQHIHYTPLYEPPEGFQITARVYTDQHDKMAHFDNDSPIVFPYWECGVFGSTTVPLPLQHATVRHLLGGSQPNMYSGEEFGPHPQLVIALTSLDVVLNSGQVQTFSPGDVILLEDVLSGGHKLKGHDNQDMTVMILTLPQHYHQVGKDKSSLDELLKKSKKTSPCKTGLETSDGEPSVQERALTNKIGDAIRSLRPSFSENAVRRTILTSIGLTLSTVAGDFLGKVAPLWLAVLFGGGCFVTGSTVAFVKVGEYAMNEIEMWQERRLLQIQGSEKFNPPPHSTATSSSEEENNERFSS